MILVTGGTGFVGGEVIRELLSSGYRVRLLVRHPERTPRYRSMPGIELVQGDALIPETLLPAMAGVQAVIHLIGIIAETSRVTFEQGHVEATRNVLSAAKAAGVTRWVQMSAAGTRPRASSRYHLTKWEAEELVRQSGLDWTIFRPSLIYGYDERDRLLNLLRMTLSGPFFPVLNGGKALIQPVSVRDVAYCFARAVASEASIGREYDLVGPAAFSWRNMVLQLARTLHRSIWFETIPILLVLRTLMWLAIAVAPAVMILSLERQLLSLTGLEISTGLWVVLVLAACRWQQVIVFSLPVGPLRLASRVLKAYAPKGLQFHEQLKMAVEDNVGDPIPAMKAFSYTPESFEQGVTRLYSRGRTS